MEAVDWDDIWTKCEKCEDVKTTLPPRCPECVEKRIKRIPSPYTENTDVERSFEFDPEPDWIQLKASDDEEKFGGQKACVGCKENPALPDQDGCARCLRENRVNRIEYPETPSHGEEADTAAQGGTETSLSSEQKSDAESAGERA